MPPAWVKSCSAAPFVLAAILATVIVAVAPAMAQVGGMAQEQAREKIDLQNMHNEVNDIKGNINGALNEIDQLQNQQASPAANAQEVHLIVKEANVEINAKTSLACYTYNGKLPGPEIRVHEGDVVRVILHNQLKVPTSLIFHGVSLPQSVSGLPRRDAGLVQPGGSFVYQFSAPQAGTYWYHPQVVHVDQKARGLFGLLIVEPRSRQSYERDIPIVLNNMVAATGGITVARAHAQAGHAPAAKAAPAAGEGQTSLHAVEPFPTASGNRSEEYFLFNGKTAPAIAPIDLRKGERIRLRVVNAGTVAIPLSLSGHKFEVVSIDGSDALEPHISRDTVTLQPSDRCDLEFTADNPGVWSLSSEIPVQATNQGSFPGGIACVVRYSGQ